MISSMASLHTSIGNGQRISILADASKNCSLPRSQHFLTSFAAVLRTRVSFVCVDS